MITKRRVHMVSFQNTEITNAYTTLMAGQGAQEWQIKLLEDFVKELKGQDGASRYV